MTWKPLVEEKDRKVYLDKLAEISDYLMKNAEKSENNIGVMGGKTGIALFYFYYAQITMNEAHIDYAHGLLEDIFDAINNDFSMHTLAGGLAGIGWAMELLVQNDFIEADTDEILGGLDPFLYKAMMHDIKGGNYDFLHGAVGTGTYFLSRLPRPEAAKYLTDLVAHLDKLAEEDENGGLKWRSTLDHEKQTKGYNLSLSHGMSSIIAFLGKLLEAEIETETVSRLLEGAVKYLFAHEMDLETYKSYFPSWVSPEYPPSRCRLAWCYGDLGVGAALLQAAKSAGNEQWEKKALEVLEFTAQRRDLKENLVIDPGLCHGAAGNGHIFMRLYNVTGNELFKETALYWLEQTLNMATHPDGCAGFKAWHTEAHGGWVAEPGLLEGGAGIGLTIISAISEMAPNWDRCLLVS